MSFAISAIVATVAVSAYVSHKNGEKQVDAQKKAMQQAKLAADRQAKLADQDMNRANQKRASTGAALDSALQSGKAGPSGTMLTGPQGVSADLLNLGKNTLLGS